MTSPKILQFFLLFLAKIQGVCYDKKDTKQYVKIIFLIIME